LEKSAIIQLEDVDIAAVFCCKILMQVENYKSTVYDLFVFVSKLVFIALLTLKF